MILLTEQEHLDKTEIKGTGRANPLAQKFADSFSASYSQIAEKKPLYLELEALFRIVALAKIAKYQSVNVDLSYLLDHSPLSWVDVPPTLPGLANLKQFQHRRDVAGGYELLQLWLPSCGGVDIGINVTADSFDRDRTGRLPAMKRELLSARPSPEALYWDTVLRTPYRPVP